MVKAILFDTDGMIIHREMYFSERFSKTFGVPIEKILPFFKNEFQLCLTGKADLKQELTHYLSEWKWKRSVGDLLLFWFGHENKIEQKLLEHIASLRTRKVQCYLDTNNEKYRVQYLLDVVGLKDHFDGVFSSSEIGSLKSQPEFWSLVYKRLGVPEKSAVVVWDDETVNVEAAKDFGFHTELYSDFQAYENRMKLFL